ncbi:acylneuraminate cytidylyltransferase family protein BpsG (plasmid) [Bacillus tropicus]|uniref:acylneuraminate cytidylyltransferase family protein BpsG n=1 Tax=Bacillus TaxID=1386 RepID=UPI00103664DE|nr:MULTISPECIES: acylneuraminate cytidylyltransferase family protein BpsG [Bacillus]WBO93056.1 acylneuraminate cytidylyltransferase family protein BpsG [Bacillus tropicus]
MYGGKTFVAIIPARGGSKGIPQKNVSVVGGKPLIQYTIDEAQNSKYLDDFIVSTDDREIAKIAKECGAKVPFLRPKELAGDKIKTIDVLIHAVQSLSVMGKKYDYVVLLQPTQPLRKSMHIDEAIQHIIKKKEQSLVSVNEVNEHPLLMRSINEKGHLESLLKVNSTVRRQDFLKFFKINGAIYINKINENFNQNTSLNDNRLAYVMEKKYDLDIDEPKDLEKFKHLISKELNTG